MATLAQGALVAAHDDLQEILGRGWWELAHVEVVEDEQRDGREMGERGLASAGELCIGELVDERVRLAIEHAMALLDDGHADGLGEMTLASAWRAEEQAVLVLGDERPVASSKTSRRLSLRLKSKSKASRVLPISRKPACLRRRSSSRSCRRSSSAPTSVQRKSIGASFSACAWRSRDSRPAAMPEQRSWRRARCSSTRFMLGSSPGSSAR